MFALVALFLAGVIVLAATFGINAEAWVFKRANKHIYSSGQIVAAGTIYDRNGKVLAQTVDGERRYNSSSTVRRATLHTVGDSRALSQPERTARSAASSRATAS